MFNKQHSLLLAFSGGPDSVVLAHLLAQAGFRFSLAHCNFKLRGKDSDQDETFSRRFAKQLGVPFYTQSFDVSKYAKAHGVSTQMAARDLRYHWFEALRTQHAFDWILTAHHLNDSIETFFLNLLRGAGIHGLTGIAETRQQIIRPLLDVTKSAILDYADEHKLRYRQDKTNQEPDYDRNYLRLKVLPLLQELKPGFETVMATNLQHLQNEAGMLDYFLEQRLAKLQIPAKGYAIALSIPKLRKEPFQEAVLQKGLASFGFKHTQFKNILQALQSSTSSGKQVLSRSHRLVIDRDVILVRTLETIKPVNVLIPSLDELLTSPHLKVKTYAGKSFKSQKNFFVSMNQLQFPLEWRTWKKGDTFKPYGMKGVKKLSDLFKDLKLNTFDKDQIRVLVNGNGELMWVAGYRSDDRYKVSKGAKQILAIQTRD